MNSLKALTSKMKENKRSEVGQGWYRPGEIEKERQNQFLKEEEERELKRREKEAQKVQDMKNYFKSKEKFNKRLTNQLPVENPKLNKKEFYDSDKGAVNSENVAKNIPKINKNNFNANSKKREVIDELREMGEPATLFGEDDIARFNRLLQLQEQVAEKEEEKAETEKGGERNIFQEDMQLNDDEFKRRGLGVLDEDIKNAIMPESKEEIQIIRSKFKQENKNYRKFESDLRRLGITEKCDIVLSWTKRIMKDWDEELEHYSEKYRNTAEGTMKLGDYRHCSRNIKPLFKQLQKEDIAKEILDGLFLVVKYCLLREYVKANEKYFELSIGNAPWPMGVTMVGIHERSGRARIYTSQVAHIFNI